MPIKAKEERTKKGSKKKAKSDSTVDIAKDIGRSKKKAVAEKAEVEAEDTEIAESELPSVETDDSLKKMAEESNKVEKQVEKKGKKTKSKVAASEKDVEEKPYLSVSSKGNDGQAPKGPVYSDPKNRGSVYISHVPHGFYEKQMRAFFSQFGTVTNLRLGRSKKTGKSRGYAFVEFKYMEVAKVGTITENVHSYSALNTLPLQVVAESMNNYLMFDKILKCSVVPPEKANHAMFRGKINPHFPPKKSKRMAAKKKLNCERTGEAEVTHKKNVVERLNKKLQKLKDAGIDYDLKMSQ